MQLSDYKNEFLSFLKEKTKVKEPENLYQPVAYILQLGGKRLRPILALLSADAFGSRYTKALDAALAVEVFHNFTLLHDDIMDQAPIRRGQQTVHEKWDVNTGILSGDVMLINAYQFLESYQADVYKDLSILFSKTAQEVCEGQQYDMDFETRNDVDLEEYMEMIRLKTSVLVAASLQMGAIIAGASSEEQEAIYSFGIALGLAFQLQDDYLDTFGDQATFGKQIGGDILENKKTWLYLKALEKATDDDREILFNLYNDSSLDSDSKITTVKQFFKQYKIDTLIQNEIQVYSDKAIDLLQSMDLQNTQQVIFSGLVSNLAKRTQ